VEGFAEQKVPGGKMVSVRLVYGTKIKSVQILGDFFLHPEETLPKIERALVGTSPRAKREEISGKIARVLAMNNAELIGVTPDAIADTIMMAVKK